VVLHMRHHAWCEASGVCSALICCCSGLTTMNDFLETAPLCEGFCISCVRGVQLRGTHRTMDSVGLELLLCTSFWGLLLHMRVLHG
jgi:hypothetical protein